MKQIVLSIYLIICTLSLYAQDMLYFATSEHDFGVIYEVKGPVSYVFKGVNKSDVPIVVLDIVTTCGCAIPKFSKKPILAGGEFEVEVIYDPRNQFGTFSRNFSIFSVDRVKIATLRLSGRVIVREKKVDEIYPIGLESGFRLTSTTAPFSYIYRGRSTTTTIGYINNSNSDVSIELDSRVSSGFLEVDYPRTIAPEERGEINFRYLIPESSASYGEVNDTFSLVINGKRAAVYLVTHGISVDNPNLMEDNRAPKIELLKNFVNFATVKRGSAMQSKVLTISNTGRRTLNIRAVAMIEGVTTSLMAGDSIVAGKSLDVKVLFDPTKHDYGAVMSHITIITDDPVRPMRRVRVAAVVEN